MILLADSAKRSRAVDPAKSFHLEAPAGSGKTFLLTARFLRLLGLVAHPQQILALTFTNKAAAEMRERVRGYLERAKRGDEADNEADAELLDYASKALRVHGKLEELLLAGEILRIQTFHAFCYTVASQAPLEAGIAPGSTLMDENEQEFFLRETVDEVLQEIADRNADDPARRALMNRLLYLNNSWWLLASEMIELVKRREGVLDLVRILGRDRASGYLAGQVRNLVETELRELRADFEAYALGRGWTKFLKDIGDLGAPAACTLPASIPLPVWESLPEWICLAQTLLTNDGNPRKQLGPKAGFYSGFSKSPWGESVQGIPPGTAERLHLVRALPAHDAPVRDPDTLWDLVVLLHSILETYDAKRRSRRVLDFAALELAALRLFDSAEPSDLQLILDQQIRHILVDEFQDTSREQWELLQKLCAGWSDGDGRTLFLVGDPKQSIYGFRKAEVRLFMEARQGLPVEGGGKITVESIVLDSNFRSQPHLIDWCNDFFAKTAMAGHRPEFDEVPFSPSVVSPTTKIYPDPRPQELALFLEWPDRESARRREAQWLAARVARGIEDHGRDFQAAILLFSRTHLPVYLEALQQIKIPVQVKEGLKLIERPEVRYLWQLCRGIVMPHDDLAWAAQLRSPWLCVDFDRIYAISREEPVPWVEKIRAWSRKDAVVARFWEGLTGAWQHIGHEPLADVIEAAWLDLDGARIVGQRWGSRGLTCCRRFLGMLREAEQGEPVRTLMRAEQLLEKSYEPVDPDTASSNIFLSTVHGAKGLEFDTVFIPFLDWDPVSGKKGQPPPYMLERAPGSGDHLLAPRPDRLMGGEDPLYAWLRRLRSKRQFGESKRLLYVAVTRARRELVLSAVVRKKANGFSTGGQSPLGWLDQHFGLDSLAGIDAIRCPEAPHRADGGHDKAAPTLHPAGTTEKPRPEQDMARADTVGEWTSVPPFSKGGQSLPRTRSGGGFGTAGYKGSFSVLVEPRPGGCAPPPVNVVAAEVNPAPFEREKPAFKVISPSLLAKFDREAEPAPLTEVGKRMSEGGKGSITLRPLSLGFREIGCAPNLWGSLVHRLLAEFGTTGTLPSARKAGALLRREGIAHAESISIAQSAISEVQLCLADPWLGAFYALPPGSRKVEWPIECIREGRVIFSGVIDLAAEFDGKWKLVDFKTARPAEGESIDDFRGKEIEVYRPQLLAYREMWRKFAGVGEGKIEAFIYWTALRAGLSAED